MIIKVKQTHINKGVKADPFLCPVAIALKEQTGNKFSVYGPGMRYGMIHYKMSRSISRFIKKFDNHGKTSVRPFNFKLNSIS